MFMSHTNSICMSYTISEDYIAIITNNLNINKQIIYEQCENYLLMSAFKEAKKT